MVILDKKTERPKDVEMSSISLRWVVAELTKEGFQGWCGGTTEVPKSVYAFREP